MQISAPKSDAKRRAELSKNKVKSNKHNGGHNETEAKKRKAGQNIASAPYVPKVSGSLASRRGVSSGLQSRMAGERDGAERKQAQSSPMAPVAWGYEDSPPPSEQKKRNGRVAESLLWLAFVVLLSLVIVFSQRRWLLRIFPFHSHQQLQMNVEILRPAKPPEQAASDAKDEPNSPAERGQANAQTNAPASLPTDKNDVPDRLAKFNSLLRLDSANANSLEGGRRLRDVRLFFVRVEDDGQLQLKSVLHKVPFDQTPLSRTVEKLLKGPSPQEINQGLHSMLPPELQVLGIRLVGTTAFINLSQEFYQITQLSAVLLAAVKQLVFTVTEYPNVQALRILVEGQPIFSENLGKNIIRELKKQGAKLDSEIRREDLWYGEMGDFSAEF